MIHFVFQHTMLNAVTWYRGALSTRTLASMEMSEQPVRLIFDAAAARSKQLEL